MFSSASELQYTGVTGQQPASKPSFFVWQHFLYSHDTNCDGHSNTPHRWHKLGVHLRTLLLSHYHTVLITCSVYDIAYNNYICNYKSMKVTWIISTLSTCNIFQVLENWNNNLSKCQSIFSFFKWPLASASIDNLCKSSTSF